MSRIQTAYCFHLEKTLKNIDNDSLPAILEDFASKATNLKNLSLDYAFLKEMAKAGKMNFPELRFFDLLKSAKKVPRDELESFFCDTI